MANVEIVNVAFVDESDIFGVHNYEIYVKIHNFQKSMIE